MTSDVEEFWVLALRCDKSVIDKVCLFRGTVDACMVHPRDVVRYVCTKNASSFFVAHNHPSQDSRPSPLDLLITQRLVELSDLMQIPLIDHIIVTKKGYFSFADSGHLVREQNQMMGEELLLSPRR